MKIKKYLLEALLVITCVVMGIVMLSCNANPVETPDDNQFVIPSATATPAPTPEPTATVEPSATPEPTQAPLEFTTGDKSYFSDALFIGDSRTVGLCEYADLGDSTFFCSVGMNSFKIFDEKVDVKGIGTTNLNSLLKSKQFGKVYILLGINELGSDKDIIVEKISAIVDAVKETQPDALIFLQANMHVTAKKNASDKTFNNEKIDALNAGIEALCDDKTIFYIDVNELFDDENGCLKADYSGDGIHVNGKGYAEWGDWFTTKEIIFTKNETN